MYKKRKLKVNVGKSKVMLFERREEEVIDFNIAHRVRLPEVASYRICYEVRKRRK